MIVIMYPQDLRSNPIFKENHIILIDNFYKWLPIKKQFEYEKSIISFLNFDIQVDKQEVIKNIGKQLKDAEDDMNKNMSPYTWRVVENIDNYKIGDVIVKADYGLLLDTFAPTCP